MLVSGSSAAGWCEGHHRPPLAIIYKRGRELSPAVRKFIDVLTSSKLPIPGHAPRAVDKVDRAERSERVEKSA